MMRRGVLIALCLAGACKKKAVEPPAALEILAAEVADGKNLEVRFVLLDGAGKRTKREGSLSVSYSMPDNSLPSCTLLDAPVTAGDYVEDAGGPVGVSKRVLTSNCVPRDVPLQATYRWTAKEMDDGLPVTVAARKVVVPKFLGGAGTSVDANAQLPPRPDATPVTLVDDIAAELATLAAIIPEADPKIAAEKCAPGALDELRLVDYDVASSFKTGTPVVDVELLRRFQREEISHARTGLSDPTVWRIALLKWGVIPASEGQALAETLARWPSNRVWGFIRAKRYVDPKIVEGEVRKYTPGLLEGTIFVVDPREKKVLCRAPLTATHTGTVPVTDKYETVINSYFIGAVTGALDQAKVAMGAPKPPVTDLPTDAGM